jgi:hypothetical protein
VLRDQVHVVDHPVVVGDQLLGVDHELHAEGRQLRPRRAGIALLEQGLAELALQVADRQGDRRLGAVRFFRRGVEALELGDPDEMPQLGDLQLGQHGKFSLSNNIYY